MSSEEEVVAEIIPTLNTIVDELSGLHGRAKKILASERRARRQEPQEMEGLLQKLEGNLAKVRECLEEMEEIPSEEKKRGEEKGKKVANGTKRARGCQEEVANAEPVVEHRAGLRKRAARNVVVREENGQEEEEDGDEQASPLALKKTRAKKLVDGGPCIVGEELVYFALPNKLDNKSFSCPLLSDDERRTMVVERRLLEPVEFSTFSKEAQARYLDLLEADISMRFRANAPVILKDNGKDMLAARSAVIEDPSQVEGWFDSLAKHAVASKQLSTANNTVLILAASLHAKLAASAEPGWYSLFKTQLAEFCKSCSVKFSTVERFLVAGSLMLRCPVLACMLPFFLVSNSAAIGILLDDEEVVGRWEQLFQFENGEVIEMGDAIEISAGELEVEEEQTPNTPVLEQSPVASDDLGELHLAEEHLPNRYLGKDDGLDENLLYLIPEARVTPDVKR